MTNEERAARGEEPLALMHQGPTEENIIDLVTNLLHLAHQEGLDPQAILRMAEIHFEEEK